MVADPRKIWLTKLAKRHLQLRPGSDVWLLNAMMHTILEEGLQNDEYIRVKNYSCAEFWLLVVASGDPRETDGGETVEAGN